MHPRRCRRREFALPCRRVALRRAWGPPRLDRPRAKAGRLHSPFSGGAQGSCGSRRRASQREAGPRASCRVAMTFIKSDSGIQTPWCNCGRARPGETACRRSAAGRGYPKPRFTPVPCGVSPEPSRGLSPTALLVLSRRKCRVLWEALSCGHSQGQKEGGRSRAAKGVWRSIKQAGAEGAGPSAPVAQGPSLPVASRPEEEPPGDGRPQACGQGAPGWLVTPEVRAARRARQGAATASCRSGLAIDKNMTTAGRSTSSTCGFFFLPM